MQLQRQLPPESTGGAMICAACGTRTETTPCRSCGQSPLLKGRYRLLDLLSGDPGGMEYRAVDARRPDKHLLVRLRPIAPSVVRDANDPQFVGNLSVSMRGMDHPAVLPWIDAFQIGSTEHPTVCVLTEEPRGTPLSAELNGAPWPLSRVVTTLEELLGIAAHLHGMEPAVAISTVDPTRVLRRPDGALLLTHAAPPALAQHVGADPICEAPERRRGRWIPASDVYAIAALGVGLLLGRHPRSFADPGGFLVWTEAARNRGPIVELLSRWLSPDPAARPATAAAALRELRRLSDASLSLSPDLEPAPPEAATVLVTPTYASQGPNFTYDSVEGQTEGARKARRAALERTTGISRALDRNTGVGRNLEPTTGISRALGRNTDISRIQPLPAQVTPEQVVAQSTPGARFMTVALSVTIAAAAVLAVQSISSRMGWIDSDPWVDMAKSGEPTSTASGLQSTER